MENASKQQPPNPAPRRVAVRGNHERPQSAADIREFLKVMREKHPQQVMQGVGDSSLTRGIIVATLATIVLLVAFSAGPYAWGIYVANHKSDTAPGKTGEAQPAAVAESTPAAAQPAGQQQSGGPDQAQPTQPGQPVVSKKTMERLGVDEVKESDPGVNPLDNKIDDLFDKTR